MTKTIPTTIGVLIVVLVAGVAGASVLFFNQEVEEVVVLEEETFVEVDEIAEEDIDYDKEDVVDVKDETDNWNTYRNEEYGFKIKYPENWIVSEDEECGYQFRKNFETIASFGEVDSHEKICIDVADNKEKVSLEEYFEEQKEKYGDPNGHVIYFPFVDLEPRELISVSNVNFHEILIPGVFGTRAFISSFDGYVLNVYTYEGQEEIFDTQERMISSFSVLD